MAERDAHLLAAVLEREDVLHVLARAEDGVPVRQERALLPWVAYATHSPRSGCHRRWEPGPRGAVAEPGAEIEPGIGSRP
jgi:hypothetical protein